MQKNQNNSKMIILLLVISVPAAALLCKRQDTIPYVGIVYMQPNGHVDLECYGAPNISVHAPDGKIDWHLKSNKFVRFTYRAPTFPSFALATGTEITCYAAHKPKCYFAIEFDFTPQVLDPDRMIEVLPNTEVNVSNPFLANEMSHQYSFRYSTADVKSNWTNYTVKPLRLFVRNDTLVHFELKGPKVNETLKAYTHLKTKKTSRTSTVSTSVSMQTSTSSAYSELAHLIAMLIIYSIILCISELLKYFTNKD
jgi:hypothetical protein